MNLIERPKDFDYPEIRVRISTIPDFPDTCPCCDAELVDVKKETISPKAYYACGGKYATIPQIQNHTDKFRGECGEAEPYHEKERVAKLLVVYNMFCNWGMFSKELKEKIENPTIKDHVVYKIRTRLSAPTDWTNGYADWVDENFDKYKHILDISRGSLNYGRFLDPRFICGFHDDLDKIEFLSQISYATDSMETAKRAHTIAFNEYGNLQFYENWHGGSSMIPTKSSLSFAGMEEDISAKT